MLALSPPLFSTFGWPLEDPISHDQQNNNYNNNNIIYRETEATSDQSFFLSQAIDGIGGFKCNSNEVMGDETMAKKLNHNASERDRRKRINSLYSSLRSLLPAADQMKKLSIPATVSRVLKYIPELQREVERLIHKKEELTSRINSRQEDLVTLESRRKCMTGSSISAISLSPMGEREVVIQICTLKAKKNPLSDVMLNLEEDGLLLLNTSCFEAFGERVFYNLHFQVQGAQKIEFEVLREKLLSFYEKREEAFI
ncbi:transcription factor ORG2-like [Actinidia eriantha]|uniref:transcription factor ORG2-like n=1 Tax=Actinidia eriantha TaxID=165200 RepID=UPI002587F048|nr:transcription factor ORG2-like [Actinidia eriantha]